MPRLSLESKYQKHLIDRISDMLPGCYILKNDSSYFQGIPDLLIVFGEWWGMLEVKRSINETYEPNQEYHISRLDEMSFCAMICPENEEDVINALQLSLRARRGARLPQR